MTTQLFKINGMHCEACTKLTSKWLKSLPGVSDATVDLQSGIATVTTSRDIPTNEVNTALSDSEYSAEEYHE